MVAVQEAWEVRRPLVPPRQRLRIVAPPRARRLSPAVYRRRRLVALVVLALTTAVLFLSVLGAQSLAGSAGGEPSTVPGRSPASIHVVQPGDTLWDVARSMQPQGDVRPLVDHLAARYGPVLQVGDQLRLD